MKHAWPLLLAICSALTGCLQTSTTVLVRADGSAQITDTLLLTEQTTDLWREFAKTSKRKLLDVIRQEWPDTTSPARAADIGGNTTVVSSSYFTKGKKAGLVITYAAPDVTKIRVNKNMFHEGASTDASDSTHKPAYITFERNGKAYTLRSEALVVRPNVGDTVPDFNDKETQKQLDFAQKLMKDLQITLRVTFENGIKSTTASFTGKNTVTMVHVPFNSIMTSLRKDPTVFQLMTNAKEMKPYDMELAFNRLGRNVMMEHKPVIVVETP